MKETQPDPFRFLHPALFIRGAHLIPSFTNGCGVPCLRCGPSLARADGQEDDWIKHYVNMYYLLEKLRPCLPTTSLACEKHAAMANVSPSCSSLRRSIYPVLHSKASRCAAFGPALTFARSNFTRILVESWRLSSHKLLERPFLSPLVPPHLRRLTSTAGRTRSSDPARVCR